MDSMREREREREQDRLIEKLIVSKFRIAHLLNMSTFN